MTKSGGLGWIVAKPVAHRGLHDSARGVIENSLGAFRAAVNGGFAMECDVQISRDGEAMVFHDFTLERLTAGEGRADALGAGALAALALKGGDERIPRLADMFSAVAGRELIVCEIKSRFDGDLRLTKRVAELSKSYAGPLVIKSFDPNIVAALRVLAPDIPRGIVAESRYAHAEWEKFSPEFKHSLANLLHYGETQPDFISWHVNDLPAGAPYLCRAGMGLPVMAWTVRNEAQRALAAAHADQMVFEGFVP